LRTMVGPRDGPPDGPPDGERVLETRGSGSGRLVEVAS
jgi:hypothetical protein